MKMLRLFVPAVALVAASGCALDPTTVAGVLTTVLTDVPSPPVGNGGVVTHGDGVLVGPIGVLPPTTGGLHDAVGATPGEQALDMVNQARALVHVPLATLDPEMSAACAQHAKYLRLNKGKPALEGLGAHKEDPSLPGATPEGAEAGKASDISWGRQPGPAVAGLIGTLYHRTPILSSANTRIGYALEKDPDGYDISVLMFKGDGSERQVVAFPADGQVDVPPGFDGGEFPNPVPDDAGATGYPVTLALPAWKKSANVKGQLFDPNGVEVPCYYSDEQHPATDFQQGDVVCMFAKQRLKHSTTYRALVSADVEGKPGRWEWKFTTETPKPVDVTSAAAMKQAVGHLSRIEGVVEYAGLTSGDDGTVFLHFTDATSAFIEADVWAKTGLGDAKKLKGKKVSLICTPRATGGGKTIQLDVREAGDLIVG